MRNDLTGPASAHAASHEHRPFATLVLAEESDDMWLATVHFPEPPEPGMTFHFRGQVWEVVLSLSFGCHAQPAVM
jgi:hypothetical protein